MKLSDFDYELPPELIAREPVRPRDASRMMLLDRRTGELTDAVFRRLPEFLDPSDVLVINDTRVMRARVYGTLHRSTGSRRDIEVLFAAPVNAELWEVLCHPGKRIRPGDRVLFDGAEGIFGEALAHGTRLLQWRPKDSSQTVESFLERYGHIPLPPYLERGDTESDAVEYQTVYAASPGAVAAPTAGLHFNKPVLHAIRQRGVELLTITLHVGIGTFLPVRSEDPRDHPLKPERYEISRDVAGKLNEAKAQGRRIVAVGTTTTRTLEYVLRKHGRFEAVTGNADLFIFPGYEFAAVGALLTNFHLPRSTLMMLVSAFSSASMIKNAYNQAIQRRYRFYSYGDCMFIV
jgi:S-adenosylmethionine:tRNA ribosyltransferase-isomerase